MKSGVAALCLRQLSWRPIVPMNEYCNMLRSRFWSSSRSLNHIKAQTKSWFQIFLFLFSILFARPPYVSKIQSCAKVPFAVLILLFTSPLIPPSPVTMLLKYIPNTSCLFQLILQSYVHLSFFSPSFLF